MNRLANTSRYLYAILSGIPIGLILLVCGINGITLNEDDLNKRTGIITELIQRDGAIFFKIKGEPKYYQTGIPERVKIIQENVHVGDEITVYKIGGNDRGYYVEKLKKDNYILIEFNRAPLVPYISLFLGLIIIIAGIIYLYQNFFDLFGGDKKQMENFIDPWRKNKN